MSCKDGETKSDPLIDSIRDGLLKAYHDGPKVTESITGQDFEIIFCGLDGSYGEVIDVEAHFQSIGDDGNSFTIKLSDEQFEKLKDLRIGSVVNVKLL